MKCKTKRLLFCIKKDMIEFLRCGRLAVCIGILVSVFILVLFAAALFPVITKIAGDSFSLLSSGKDGIFDIFPKDVKGSAALFSANVVLFYANALSVICAKIVPSEVKSGKWIIPLNAGYSYKNLVLSKCIVYSLFSSLFAFLCYLIFYFCVSAFAENNFPFFSALINAFTLGECIFLCVVCSILLSYIFMSPLKSALTVITTVIAVPDILSLFSFGRFFPTYTFTFVYNSEENITTVILPFILSFALMFFLWIIAVKTDNSEHFYK